MWDVFAVSTYFTVSLLFWYMGLIPDLAVIRDRARTKIRKFAYGLFSLGWTGSNRHWSNYEKAYLILAGLCTPLVLSVHSIVSLDFAVSQLPGWHTTIFPPYFVAGAMFSGFGMVLTLLIPLRKICGLEDIITDAAHRPDVQGDPGDRVDRGLRLRHGGVHRVVQRQSPYERFAFFNRAFGPVLVGLLDHDHLQRGVPAVVLVQEDSREPAGGVLHLDPGERRHVV